jgi:hypothetical protein
VKSHGLLGWQHWSALLLLGLQSSLLLLIAAWLLRTCAPVEPSANFSISEKPSISALQKVLDHAQVAEKELNAQLDTVKSEFARKSAACTPALPADRWDKRDLGMLKGCWVLGREGKGNRGEPGSAIAEECTISAGRICFDDNGHGQRESRSICPVGGTYECKAPVAARFNDDGTFTTTQPDTLCVPGTTNWVARTLSCHRVGDSSATCMDSSRMGVFTYEFRREQ